MKVELKQIIEELSDALNLNDEYKISSLIDDNDNIAGWTIVKLLENGTIIPIKDKTFEDKPATFKNLKDLFEHYEEYPFILRCSEKRK